MTIIGVVNCILLLLILLAVLAGIYMLRNAHKVKAETDREIWLESLRSTDNCNTRSKR